MSSARSLIVICALCLLVGVLAVMQFRSRELSARANLPASDSDQAAFISQLYESNSLLQQQVSELSDELSQYHGAGSNGNNSLESLERSLADLRIANGEVAVTGPGVTVAVNGDLTLFELQDLVNELRNASAEAVAVNGVRVVTRSVIVTDEANAVTIDGQPLAEPYRLEAIGEPDTLLHALQRKGGLIALLEGGNPDLTITITKHDTGNKADWLKLPKSTAQLAWSHSQPAP